MTHGKRTSTVIGVKLFTPLYGRFLYRCGLITNEEASETSSVAPSGADRETYSAPTIWFAPGRFSTSTGCPQISEKRGARAREKASVAPPGEVGTTIFTAREGKVCAGAIKGAAASAAAANASRRTEVRDPMIPPTCALIVVRAQARRPARAPDRHREFVTPPRGRPGLEIASR